MENNFNKKSYFLNFQFITGLTLFIIFIVGVFFIYTQNMITAGKEFAGIPFVRPVYQKGFFGTDASGSLIFIKLLRTILTEAFIILAVWLVSVISGIILGYISARKKWFGSFLKEVLGFGPTIILAAILAYWINFKIYGSVLAVGLGLTPYMMVKFSESFEKKDSAGIYYYIIHGIFISALIVQLCGFVGIFSGKALVIGEIFRQNLGYAFKYPHLVIPYSVAMVFFLLFPSLMLRGVKNAHAANVKISHLISTEEKIPVREEAISSLMSKEEVKTGVEEKKKIRPGAGLDISSEIYSGCSGILEIEKRTSEYLVYQMGYSSSTLYEIVEGKYVIKSIHKKTVPVEMIDLAAENVELNEKIYKLDFLNSLLEKNQDSFVYPGRDNYDRIYSPVMVRGIHRYILEVTYNNQKRNKDDELNRIEQFLPIFMDAITSVKSKDTVHEEIKVQESFEVGAIGKIEEKIDDSGRRYYSVRSSVGKVIYTEDAPDKKYYKIIKSDGRVIREAEKISSLIEKDEMILDIGLKPVTSEVPFNHLLITEEYEEQPIGDEEIYQDEPEAEEFFDTPDSENEMIREIGNDDADIGTTGDREIQCEDEPALNPQSDDVDFDEINDWIFSTPFEDKLRKGLKYLRLKDYDRALSLIKDANAMNSNSYETYMALGHIYRHKELYHEALENYRYALKINKFSSHAYNYIGNVFYKINKPELALQAWQQAYHIDPERTLINKNIEKLKKVIDKKP